MAKNCKYQKYQKYVSYDNGATWQPMQEFQKGELIEASSTDCGGGTVVYQWVVDSYYCNNSDRYATEKKQVSYNNGQSWEDVVPTETKSTLVERNSPYCGSYQYRWVESGTTCIGYDKWQNNIRQVSRDGGQTWENVGPPEYSASTVIEYNSEDCGYVPPTPTQYRWYPSGTTCIGYDKYQNNIKQISYDSGQTWENVSPPQYSASTLIEHNSEDCGYVPPTPVEYRWYPSGYTCIGYDKWQNNIKQQSTDGGETWTNVSPPEYSASTVIEYNSEDCGYVPPTPVGGTKWVATYSDSHTESAECDSTSAITENEITLRNLVAVEIGDCVTSIGSHAFLNADDLTGITIPDNVTSIGDMAFRYCNNLSSVTIGDGVTIIYPYAFDSCGSLTSVTIGNSVQTIGGWAFSHNWYLSSVTIPDSVTTIGGGAFSEDLSLTAITIPSGVTSIGDLAFSGSSSLTSVTVEAITPPTLGSRAFDDTASNLVIYVPCASVDAYKSASVWSAYANRIQGIPPCEPTVSTKWVATYSGGTISSAECDSSSAITSGEIDLSGITSVEIGDCVTTISEGVFANCGSLTSVTISNSVTTIGDYAFACCRNLRSVNFGSSVTSIGGGAFHDCDLSSISIPDSVTSIGEYAFSNCTSLTSVTIGSGVTSIDNFAFSNCADSLSVTITTPTPPSIGGNNVFEFVADYKVYVPCESISAYQNAWGWRYASNIYGIPPCGEPPTPPFFKWKATYTGGTTSSAQCDYTESISYREINNTDLVAVEIGNCTTSIGNDAFSGYTSLTSVTIGSAVTSIGTDAFYQCYNLTSVTIPDSVTSINYEAFFECSGLTSVNIPSGVTSISESVFSDCYSLSSITIPSGVTSIGRNAFVNCRSLSSVTIPNSVTSIGYGAFDGCTSLTSATIGNSVTSIDGDAFWYCTSLTSVTIPSSVTSIGNVAFYNCSGLTSITVLAATPPTLGRNVFTNTNCPIYVPSGSVNAYKSATNWSTYASRIQAIPNS